MLIISSKKYHTDTFTRLRYRSGAVVTGTLIKRYSTDFPILTRKPGRMCSMGDFCVLTLRNPVIFKRADNLQHVDHFVFPATLADIASKLDCPLDQLTAVCRFILHFVDKYAHRANWFSHLSNGSRVDFSRSQVARIF